MKIPSQVLVDRFLRNEISHQYKLNAYEKLILFFLASYMGRKKYCNPSFIRLAIDCSLSSDSVKRYIPAIEKKGLINVERRRGINNKYSFTEKLGAISTQCSEHLVAISTENQVLLASGVGANSPTNNSNNITNNINRSLKMTRNNKHGKKKDIPFPDDMTINDSHKEMARKFGLDVDSEFIKFKENHLSKGNEFKRWDMAFNTWLRRAYEYSQRKVKPATASFMEGAGRE